MTAEELFNAGEPCPPTGLFPRDWFSFGSAFAPAEVVFLEGGSVRGMRVLSAFDAASGFSLGAEIIPKRIGPVYASALIPFMDRVIKGFGEPRKGVVISHSCWLSSAGLLADPDTAERGELARDLGASFPAMPEREKEKLTKWGKDHGLAVLFDGDEMW